MSPEQTALFTYQTYGLVVASEIEWPDLAPTLRDPASADVRVWRGHVPEHIESPAVAGVLFEARASEFLLRVESVGRILVRSGREIVVHLEADPSNADVRVCLLGPVLTALLHQRHMLVLHGGAVAAGPKTVVLAGHSGVGKSTVLAALETRGYEILSDDVAAIALNAEGQPMVHPGFPQLRLWKDAVRNLGHLETTLSRARHNIEKYLYPIETPRPVPRCLTSVCVLTLSSDRVVNAEPTAAAERFRNIRLYTRNRRAMEGLCIQRVHFRLAAAVAARVPMTEIARPRGRDSVDEVVARVVALL